MSRLDYVLNKIKVGKKLTKDEATELYNGVKLLLLKRGGGKTTRIIEECKKNNGILIVISADERNRLIRDGIMDSDHVKTWNGRNEWIWGLSHDIKLYIDNVDQILEKLLCREIGMITMSGKRDI